MQEETKPTPYRVHTPLVALTHENDGRTRFVAIPRGSLFYVAFANPKSLTQTGKQPRKNNPPHDL